MELTKALPSVSNRFFSTGHRPVYDAGTETEVKQKGFMDTSV